MRVLWVLVSLLVADGRVADACSVVGNRTFEIDPAGPNVSPPGEVNAVVTYAQSPGDGQTCKPNGIVYIDLSTASCSDIDGAPSCGYRFKVIEGRAFDGLTKVPVAESYGGSLVYYLAPDASFDFTTEVRAVNRLGTEGPPTVVHLAHQFDDGGCNTSKQTSSLLVLLFVAGLPYCRSRSLRRRR